MWRQVQAHSKAAKRRLAAVAYVSTDSRLGFGRNDVLICDASDRAVREGLTSARLLQSLHKKGVEILTRPDLHAKVAVLGRHALIGSCNFSVSSAEVLTELALFTDRSQVVAQTMAFIHSLRKNSERVDDSYLRRILKIKVRRANHGHLKRAGSIARIGNKAWLVSVRELAENHYPAETAYVEKAEKKAATLVADDDATISWIRMTGKSRFRRSAQPGDRVFQIWKSLSGKRTTVSAPFPIVSRQDVDHWTRLYISEPEDSRSLSWARFIKALKKYGMPRVPKGSCRELTFREEALLEESLN